MHSLERTWFAGMSSAASPFRGRGDYAGAQDYRLLPFRFGQQDGERYILTNDVGEYVLLRRDELVALKDRTIDRASTPYRKLKSRHFLFDDASKVSIDLLALKYRTRLEPLADFTGLHIFV